MIHYLPSDVVALFDMLRVSVFSFGFLVLGYEKD